MNDDFIDVPTNIFYFYIKDSQKGMYERERKREKSMSVQN